MHPRMPAAAARAAGPPDPAGLPRVADPAVFVPHDRLGGRPHVVVDGRSDETAVLELSHWPGCRTPPGFADVTATAIVDRYLRAEASGPEVAAVTNNHYDVDGVLSAWLLLERPPEGSPERALALAAAEAGDFATWTDPWALRAAITLVGLAEASTTPLAAVRAALAPSATRDPSGPLHEAILPRVGRVLRDPERFGWLWEATWAAVAAGAALFDAGDAVVEEIPGLDLAVVRAPDLLPRPVVCPRTERSRILHATPDGRLVLEQRYETWVAFSARPLPPRADLAGVVPALAAEETRPGRWSFEGLDQSTPRLTLLGPGGRPAPSGIPAARLVEHVAPLLADPTPGEPSATLAGGPADAREAG